MYDFESRLNRKITGAVKWQARNTKQEEYSEDIIPLSVADMEFKVMDEVKEALHEAVDIYDPYGYQGCTEAYLESVCDWMRKRHHAEIEKEWIVTSDGVVDALKRSVERFTNPGEGVIIFTPVYPPFFKAAACNETRVLECPLLNDHENYSIDFDTFEKLAQDPKTTMLLLCSPHNPVGRVYSSEELNKIVSICKKNHLWLIADEIHHDLILEGVSFTSMLEYVKEYNHIVVCTSASKSFNLAGLKLSNILIPDIDARNQYIGGDHFSINPFSMAATQCAYEKGERWLKEMMQVVKKNNEICKQFFQEYFPKSSFPRLQGTYLMWINMNSYYANEDEMFEDLYDVAKFVVNRGSTFGKEGMGYMRINLALPTHLLEESLNRLKQLVEKNKKI